jgi:hypothetical protein
MNLYGHLDEHALRSGNADATIELPKLYSFVYLISGIILGAPLFLMHDDKTAPNILCRLKHLKLPDTASQALAAGLTSSFNAWTGTGDEGSRVLDNPAVLVNFERSAELADRRRSYFLGQHALDLVYAQGGAYIFTNLRFLLDNRMGEQAAGAIVDPNGRVESLRPIGQMIPSALMQATSIDANLLTRESEPTAVENSYLDAISWARIGRNETAVIKKFSAYWTALEACFPKSYYGSNKYEQYICILFALPLGRFHKKATPAQKAHLSKVKGSRSIQKIFREISNLRARIFHQGLNENTLTEEDAVLVPRALHFLKQSLLSRCKWLLSYGMDQQIVDLEALWNQHIIGFVLDEARFARMRDTDQFMDEEYENFHLSIGDLYRMQI